MKYFIWLLFGIALVNLVLCFLEDDKLLSQIYETQALISVVGATILFSIQDLKKK